MIGNAHILRHELFGAMSSFSFLRLGHYFYLRFRRFLRFLLRRPADANERPLHEVWDVNTPEPAWGWLPLALTATAVYYTLKWLWRLVFPAQAAARPPPQSAPRPSTALPQQQQQSSGDEGAPESAAWPSPASQPVAGAPLPPPGYAPPGYAPTYGDYSGAPLPPPGYASPYGASPYGASPYGSSAFGASPYGASPYSAYSGGRAFGGGGAFPPW